MSSLRVVTLVLSYFNLSLNDCAIRCFRIVCILFSFQRIVCIYRPFNLQTESSVISFEEVLRTIRLPSRNNVKYQFVFKHPSFFFYPIVCLIFFVGKGEFMLFQKIFRKFSILISKTKVSLLFVIWNLILSSRWGPTLVLLRIDHIYSVKPQDMKWKIYKITQ